MFLCFKDRAGNALEDGLAAAGVGWPAPDGVTTLLAVFTSAASLALQLRLF